MRSSPTLTLTNMTANGFFIAGSAAYWRGNNAIDCNFTGSGMTIGGAQVYANNAGAVKLDARL
jgi:hypothetical protein